MKVNKVRQFFLCRHQIDVSGLVAHSNFAADLIIKQDFIGIWLQRPAKFRLLLLGLAAAEHDLHIILGHIPELDIHDFGNRIPDAKAGHQQCCTPANAHQHHHQPLVIAEDIANGHLIEKADMPPQRKPFNQQRLAGGRRFWTDQLRRNLL